MTASQNASTGKCSLNQRHVLVRAVSLLLILHLSLLFPAAVRAARYVDMPGNWAERYVDQLSDEGVIPKAQDGKFYPSRPVTRAVFSFWLVNTLGIKDQPTPSTSSFPDVKTSDWYWKATELVKQNNYIAAYSDGFRPNQDIQRGEVIVIISRTLSVAEPDETTIARELAKYKDGLKVPAWARKGIAKASLAGLKIAYLGKDEKSSQYPQIRAATLASRADTAALLYALDMYKTNKSIADATANAEKGVSAGEAGGALPALSAQQPIYGQDQNGNGLKSNNTASTWTYGGTPAFSQPAMAQSGYPYQMAQSGGNMQNQPGGYVGQGQYQGQQYAPPAGSYSGQGYSGNYPAPGGAYGGAPGGQYGGYAPANSYLQGRVAVVTAGTEFHATAVNTLDSGSTQPGEQVTATLSEPLYANGQEVIPAGSRLVGQVTNVVSARHFKFGANGRIDVRFTSIETPDGRRYPLSASIDQNQLRLTGGTTRGRFGKGLLTTGAGAAGGAALGTGLGAITGGLSHSRSIGMSTGMGAVFGTAMGSIVGLGAAAYRKGGEVKITAGSSLPIKLDESLQVSGAPGPQPYGNPYAAPVQTPAGGYYPQQ